MKKQKIISLDEDFAKVKAMFKPKLSAKEEYVARLKQIEQDKVDAEYRMKLETLDKLEFGDGIEGKIKKKFKELFK